MNQLKKINNINTTDTSDLNKKTDYNTKFNEIEKEITDHDRAKYITTQEFNKFTSQNFAEKVVQEDLASKKDIANFVNKTDFDDKQKKIKNLLQIKQDIQKLKLNQMIQKKNLK